MTFLRRAGVTPVVYAPLARTTSRAESGPREVCNENLRVPLAPCESILRTRVWSWRQAPALCAASARPAT